MSEDENESSSDSVSSAEGPPIFSAQRVSKGKRRKREPATSDEAYEQATDGGGS